MGKALWKTIKGVQRLSTESKFQRSQKLQSSYNQHIFLFINKKIEGGCICAYVYGYKKMRK